MIPDSFQLVPAQRSAERLMVQGPLRAAGGNLTKKVKKTSLQNPARFDTNFSLLPLIRLPGRFLGMLSAWGCLTNTKTIEQNFMIKTALRLSYCSGAVIAFLLVGSPANAQNPTNIVQLSLTTASSLLMQTGQTMILSLSTNLLGAVFPPTSGVAQYQWLKNGVLIDGETSTSYTNFSVSMDDAGTYSVLVSGNFNRAESEPVNVSVFFLFTNHSNGGVLTSPIQSYTFNSTSVSCGGTQNFDHWQCYLPFNGPNTSPPSTTFPNTSNGTNLDISTCLSVNGTSLNTAVEIIKNVLSPPPPFPIVACNAAAGSGCGINSALSMCTVALQTSTRYRVAIFYVGATAQNLTTVTFTWLYHN
jgi:hypothetical protein